MKKASVVGIIFLAFGVLISLVQTDATISIEPFLNRPFMTFLLALALLVQFGLGFGSFLVYKKYNLVLPGLIITGFALWSIITTIVNWPTVVLTGNDAFLPFSFYPVPFIAKWIPMTGLTLLFGGLEYIIRRYFPDK
jgi:hypothetical protein